MSESRRNSRKARLLKELAITPIVQIACSRAGVSRATYYRWREESIDFEEQADLAQAQGEDMINDLAESKLIESIKDKNLSAIKYWLSQHHHRYFKVPLSPVPYKRISGMLSRMRDLW